MQYNMEESNIFADFEQTEFFADLEKTLCESINFKQDVNAIKYHMNESGIVVDLDQPSEQDLIDCLENVKNLGRIHGPAIRAFKDKRYLDSIYCESFAMSLWMRIKFHANKVMESERHLPTEDNLFDFLERQVEERPHIIDYIDRFLKYDLCDERGSSTLKSIEFTNGTELMNLCNKLPEEWTVIQLCKQVNLDIFNQTRNEALRCPCLIFMTLFRYPMSERFNHQPIKIVLNQMDLKDLYDIGRNYAEKMREKGMYRYFSNISNEQFGLDIVSKLKKLLGPWIVLFSGLSKNEGDKSYENKMIAKVDRFLSKSKHKYSPLQNVLICLMARRLYMLTHEDIKDGALYISTTKDEWFELMDFFYDQSISTKTTPEECYPVILVVDEQIDFFYWEMCNPKQEFTRVDSIVTLLKLYFEHKDKISNGYFNVTQRRGSAVVNPDKTLGDILSQELPLMKRFADPAWNILVEQIPTSGELKTMLETSDIYFYSGHGSGLQFVSSYETCQLFTNAVVFLMGCSTTEFKARCGYALGSADYQYYHLAKRPQLEFEWKSLLASMFGNCTNYSLVRQLMKRKINSMSLEDDISVILANHHQHWKHFYGRSNPAVIGYLSTSYSDIIANFSNVVLTKWLCVTNKIGKTSFGTKSKDKQFAEYLQYVISTIKRSKYLTKVMAEYRSSDIDPIAYQAILCYRGLPVCLNEN